LFIIYENFVAQSKCFINFNAYFYQVTFVQLIHTNMLFPNH